MIRIFAFVLLASVIISSLYLLFSDSKKEGMTIIHEPHTRTTLVHTGDGEIRVPPQQMVDQKYDTAIYDPENTHVMHNDTLHKDNFSDPNFKSNVTDVNKIYLKNPDIFKTGVRMGEDWQKQSEAMHKARLENRRPLGELRSANEFE